MVRPNRYGARLRQRLLPLVLRLLLSGSDTACRNLGEQLNDVGLRGSSSLCVQPQFRLDKLPQLGSLIRTTLKRPMLVEWVESPVAGCGVYALGT